MRGVYVQLGFDHILDPNGYDHILYVLVLCVAFRLIEWRRMLVLITAFTVGHTITLGLSSLGIVRVDSTLIETLIPITIIISAVLNIVETRTPFKQFGNLLYVLTLLFGLIHGLGFSTFFKSLVGKDESIVPLLFSFNIGVELGQIVVVALMFLVSYILEKYLKVPHRMITLFVSVVCGVLALLILLGVI